MFGESYELRPGEILRRVPPPFPAQRMEYYRTQQVSQAASIPEGPDNLWIDWNLGAGTLHSMEFGEYLVGNLLGDVLEVYRQDLECDDEVANWPVTGDFVRLAGASPEECMPDLERIVGEIRRPVSLRFREAERSAIVFSGRWPEGWDTAESRWLDIYGGDSSDPIIRKTTSDVPTLGKELGDWIRFPVIFEAANPPTEIRWRVRHIRVGREAQHQRCRDPYRVAEHLFQQTGLNWGMEMRIQRRLFVEEQITASANPPAPAPAAHPA